MSYLVWQSCLIRFSSHGFSVTKISILRNCSQLSSIQQKLLTSVRASLLFVLDFQWKFTCRFMVILIDTKLLFVKEFDHCYNSFDPVDNR